MKKITVLIFSVLIVFSGILCTSAETVPSGGKTLLDIASEQITHEEHLSLEGKFFEAGITSDLSDAIFICVPSYSSMTLASLAEGKRVYGDSKKPSEGGMETVYAFSSSDGSLSYCISGQVTDGEYAASVLSDSSDADKLMQLLDQPLKQNANGVYFLALDSSSLIMICESENGLTARAFSKDKYYEFTEEEYAKAYDDYAEYRRRLSAENGGQEEIGGKSLFDVHEAVLSGEFDPDSVYIPPTARKILTAVGVAVVTIFGILAIFLVLRRRKRTTATESKK